MQTHIKRARRMLSGWGRYPVEEMDCMRPERISQATRYCTNSHNVIARGLGRSFGDAALNAGHDVLLCERLNRLCSFDRPTGILECEAGTSLQEIITFALPKGYFLGVTPSTPYISLGGAIAGDVYGCNQHRQGSFSQFVDTIQLLTANGRTVTCSRERQPDLFWATIGGLGLTGIILRAQIRLLPVETAYIEANYTKLADIDQLFVQLEKNRDNCDYTMAWIDGMASSKYIGRSLFIQGDHARYEQLTDKMQRRPLRPRRRRDFQIPDAFPQLFLNSFNVRLMNKYYYWRHLQHTRVVKYQRFFYPFAHLKNWNLLYGRNGFVRYQCLVPWEYAQAACQEIFEFLTLKQIPCYWAMLKCCRDDEEHGLLSFFKSGVSLTLDLPRNDEIIEHLRLLNDKILDWNGRLSLVSDAFMRPGDLQAMYPDLDRFLEIKSRIDPQNVFQSSLARRLEMIQQ